MADHSPAKSSSTQSLMSSLVASLVISLLAIIGSVSAASFIFSGQLSIFLPTGIGIALISSIIVGGILALRGSFYGSIGAASISSAALIGAMSQTILVEIGGKPSSFPTLLPTILMSIILVTAATGLFFYLLGSFKLGKLVRFIPYPVIGGFFAGVGSLIIRGSINVMRRVPLDAYHQLSYLFNVPTLIHIVPGVALALVLLILHRRYKHYLILPGVVLAAIALFYGVLFFLKIPFSAAVADGWLVESFSTQSVWSSYSLSSFSLANWTIISKHIGDLVVIMSVSIISLLITATGIETAIGTEIDLDKDLQEVGLGNIVSGLLGGLIGFHSLEFTLADHEAKASSRIPGLIAALICGVVAVVGASWIVCAVPKPVLGGVLLFFGIGLLLDWVYLSWFRLTKTEYALLLLIFLCIFKLGFLKGIFIGVVLSSILFVVKYSRISIIKHVLTGDIRQSNVERSLKHDKLIKEYGGHILIVTLQGYVFFGTANGLFTLVRDRLKNNQVAAPKFVIFDFKNVDGLDSSAGFSFSKIKRLLQDNKGVLILTGLKPELEKPLRSIGCVREGDLHCQVYEHLDFGLEWCEDQLLRIVGKNMDHTRSIQDVLSDWFGNPEVVKLFISYLQEKSVPSGYHIFHQNDKSDSIYILEKGQASIYLELKDGQKIRLRKIKEGAIVGEMGVYRKTLRSASFISDKDCTFYCLTDEALNRMRREHPQLAIILHKFVVCLLSDRLTTANKMISEL